MSDLLVKLFGWKATIFHGDPAVYSRYRWLKERLRPGPLRTLDAGCGSGAFTMFAASVGNEALGVSNDEANNRKAATRAAIANSTAQFKTLDLSTVNGDLGRFDQIIFLECLEHILDDARAVSNLASLLKPGGQLILCTPFKHHRPYFEEWKHQTPGVETGGHVRFGYSHDELRRICEHAGLKIIDESYHVGFVTIQLANLFLILSKVSVHLAWAVTFPLRILQLLDRPVTQLIRYPYISIGCVAVKPDQL